MVDRKDGKRRKKREYRVDTRENYLNLACRIAAIRAYEYSRALSMGHNAGAAKSAKYWENKLRGKITALDDKEIEELKRMALAGKIKRPKDYVRCKDEDGDDC